MDDECSTCDKECRPFTVCSSAALDADELCTASERCGGLEGKSSAAKHACADGTGDAEHRFGGWCHVHPAHIVARRCLAFQSRGVERCSRARALLLLSLCSLCLPELAEQSVAPLIRRSMLLERYQPLEVVAGSHVAALSHLGEAGHVLEHPESLSENVLNLLLGRGRNAGGRRQGAAEREGARWGLEEDPATSHDDAQQVLLDTHVSAANEDRFPLKQYIIEPSIFKDRHIGVVSSAQLAASYNISVRPVDSASEQERAHMLAIIDAARFSSKVGASQLEHQVIAHNPWLLRYPLLINSPGT